MDHGPRTVLAREHAPLAAAQQDREDAVEDLPQINRAWTSARLGWRQQRLEDGPLTVAQVRRGTQYAGEALSDIVCLLALGILLIPLTLPHFPRRDERCCYRFGAFVYSL